MGSFITSSPSCPNPATAGGPVRWANVLQRGKPNMNGLTEISSCLAGFDKLL
jgi:hypothetical protein